jgi:hypothetical protein
MSSLNAQPKPHFLRAGDRLRIGSRDVVVVNCLTPEPGATDSVIARYANNEFHRIHRYVRIKNDQRDIMWFIDADMWPTRDEVKVIDRKFVAAREWHD